MIFKHIIANGKSEKIFDKNDTIYNLQVFKKFYFIFKILYAYKKSS